MIEKGNRIQDCVILLLAGTVREAGNSGDKGRRWHRRMRMDYPGKMDLKQRKMAVYDR